MVKASDYIYKAIVEDVLSEKDTSLKKEVVLSLDNASEIYSDPEEYITGEYLEDRMLEASYEVRCTGTEINLSPKNHSRYFEVDCVARKFGEVWVSWDYYYGGGKHADPDAMEWIEYADILNLDKEEEVVTLVRTFSRKEENCNGC